MHVTFVPNGNIHIDDAKITYKNFAGEGTAFNREGDRNFSVIIDDQEIADALIEAGWNVKIKPPRDDQDTPFMHLPVKVKFNNRGPSAYLKSGDAPKRVLTEETIGILDDVYIIGVDLDIRPYDWELPGGKTGRSAYLQSIYVEQEVDRFAGRY
jgi:hypothetical protein